MAYNNFAQYYDLLNEAADYDALFCAVYKTLKDYNINNGIIADLGCGTAELSIMLAKKGYDVIAVDLSQDMLSIARDKMYENEISDILFLQQDLTKLDLYGTIRAAICTFDTLNHIGPYKNFEKAIKKISLFLEKDCPFIFDMNTPYKHENILKDNTFIIEIDGISCKWENNYNKEKMLTEIKLVGTEDNEILFEEKFCEYIYTKQEIINACESAGLSVKQILDGDIFEELKNDSERYFITAIKK